jgi:NADH-quinone oxidoreductase subunit N
MYLAQLILGLPSIVTMNGYFFSANGITASKLLVLAASTFVLNCSEQYIREHRRHVLEYALILTTATLMLLILVGSNNLMSMFFSIVGFSLCLYVLIFFDVDQLSSREAALKYFYLSTLSSGLILIGIFLIYATTGYAEFGALKMFFLLSPTAFNSTVVGTAIICIMIGFFFKLSAFPGHL